WSVRKLADYLTHNRGTRRVQVGRERLRQLLHKHDLTFQRTKTWKESNDPQREIKLARIEHVTATFPDRVFAFDEFGPLTIRPHTGSHPVHQATLPGVARAQNAAVDALAALKSIRAARPDGAPINIVVDNPSTPKGPDIRKWASRNKVELCFTPTYASWANPI